MSQEQRLPPSSVPRFDAPRPVRYVMADLERETGVTARTIRYYISEGLLPPAYGRGPSATYDTGHLLRLHMIQRLKDERLSLPAIRERMNQLSEEDIAVILQVGQRAETETWERHRLHEDLELLIRTSTPGTRPVAYERAFEMIIEYARSVLEDAEQRATVESRGDHG